MSRIGKKPIKIPDGVEVKIDGQKISVKGPKGVLDLTLHEWAKIAVRDDSGKNVIDINVANPENAKQAAIWGLSARLINNMIKGVTDGFEQKLEINGVGFRAAMQGKDKLILEVGFSHPVEFMVPAGITVTAEKNILTVSGIDKQLVGETAASIRRIKEPEPYKGKGIKYVDEVIRRKAGKSVTAKTA